MTPHEAASYWFVRQDSGGMADGDREAFESWHQASAEHREAYERTKAMWAGFEAAAEDSELRALRVAALSAAPMPRIWPRAVAVAASLVAALAGVVALSWRMYEAPVATAAAVESRASATRYATGQNQRSTVTLPDGTSVTMNLDTLFTMDFTGEQRLIHLSRGQAFFDVAKDLHRPFVVAAVDRKIRALGTKFDVRVDRDRLEVVLLEGRVSVDPGRSSLIGKLTRRLARVELQPDQRFVVDPGQAASVTATNAVQATSWREGWVVFEDETVEHAIAELNRYSDRPIVAAPDVRGMRLSGVFRIGQPDRFGAIIQEFLPVEVERGAHGETLLVRRPR